MEPSLHFDLIGPLRLSRDGEPVPLPASKKTRALLGYLLALDRPTRREHLIDCFWEMPDDPRGALRWSLSKLRALVDDDACCRLVADRESVQMRCREAEVDWRRLRAVATGDVRRANGATLVEVAAMDGTFMEGLDLPACDSFQAWLTAMREETKRWQITVLRTVTGDTVDPEKALEYARRWAILDPFDAIARTTLVNLLKQTGRHEEERMQRSSGINKLAEAGLPVPEALRTAAAIGTPQDGSPEVAMETPPLSRAPAIMPEPSIVQQVRFCSARDGTGLAYATVGEGPPLVKAANWLNHLEYDWESPVWRHWIAHFLEYRQLIRYDERGNGLSDWNTPEIHFEAFVDDLETVVDAAGLDSFDLLGISQGCAVSIAYAVRHPERVRRLVLYGGYAAGWKTRASEAEIEMRQAMLTLTREGWGKNNPAFRQMFSTLFFPTAGTEAIDWFNELQRMCTSSENSIRLQQAFSVIDVREMLCEVRVPTLVMHASRDAVVPFSAGRELAARIPGAEFVQLDCDNHLVLGSDFAWPRASRCIRDFLE